jgi:hypothetical protein
MSSSPLFFTVMAIAQTSLALNGQGAVPCTGLIALTVMLTLVPG